ncbi:DUF1902 domain-containing protein [Thiohalocapsa sp. ML1]|uniref:DUF1902 domain-containing protein n=1 Tax=Thiohalocapsa sp. ML1 TaxID=1431688 RepID=UPI0007320EAB|nr:DUF1902 domain-containing protein [Thiohalocapsa sp. ML1]
MNHEIEIRWDDEAKVWFVADSTVPGLVGEAPSMDAMLSLLKRRVPEMLSENGCPISDDIPLRLLTNTSLGQMRAVG